MEQIVFNFTYRIHGNVTDCYVKRSDTRTYVVSAIVDHEQKEFFMNYNVSANQYQFGEDAPEELKAIEKNISNTIQSQES